MMGALSLELELLEQGLVDQVIGYDIFDPLVQFWQMALRLAPSVAIRAKILWPKLNRDAFYCLRDRFDELDADVDRAAAFFALNRSSMNGLGFAGGYSPEHKRFTAASIEKLASFREPRLDVYLDDFKLSIPRHHQDLTFLDPPYMQASNNLYGIKGRLHKKFQHTISRLLFKPQRTLDSYI